MSTKFQHTSLGKISNLDAYDPSFITQQMQSNCANRKGTRLNHWFPINKRATIILLLILAQQTAQISAFLNESIFIGLTVVTGLLCAILTLLIFGNYKNSRKSLLLFVLISGFVAFSYYEADSILPRSEHIAYNLAISESQSSDDERLRKRDFRVDVKGVIERINAKGQRGEWRFIIKTSHGRYYLSYYQLPWKPEIQFKINDRVGFRAIVKCIVKTADTKPELFSFDGYIFRQGIIAQGAVDEILYHHSIKEAQDFKTKLVGKLIYDYSSSEELAVLVASMLGEQGLIGKELTDLFRQTGTTHVLVISGFHISTIFFALYWLARFTFSRSIKFISYIPAQIPAIIIAECGAAFYTYISGAGLSSIRALAAVSLFGLGELCGERNSRMTTFWLVFLLVCLVFPGSALEISFQLTFAAVFGLYVASDWDKAFGFKKYIGALLRPLIFSLGAWSFSLPICIAWFGSFAACAPLINAIVVPVFTFATIYMGGIALLFNYLSIPGASNLTNMSLFAIRFVINILDYLFRLTTELGLGLIELQPTQIPYALSASLVVCLVLVFGSVRAKIFDKTLSLTEQTSHKCIITL